MGSIGIVIGIVGASALAAGLHLTRRAEAGRVQLALAHVNPDRPRFVVLAAPDDAVIDQLCRTDLR